VADSWVKVLVYYEQGLNIEDNGVTGEIVWRLCVYR